MKREEEKSKENIDEDFSKDSKEEKEKKPSKKIIKKETRQLLWFLLLIAVFFAAFLIPYYYIDSQRYFEYAGANWTIEEYPNLKIYIGTFEVFTGKGTLYNLYLRNDPRKNEVPVVGNLSNFKKTTYFSFSKEVDLCRGDVPRVIGDLSSFLIDGVGVTRIIPATNSLDYSNESNLTYVTCELASPGGLIEFNIGEENSVRALEENPYCYNVTLSNCSDLKTIEKFMTEIVSYNNQILEIQEGN